MAVFYTPPNAESSVGVPWALLQSGDLTPSARLVLMYALAQKPTWTATAQAIGKELGFDRKRVMRAITELIAAGYARKTATGAGRGRPPRNGWDFAWPSFSAKVPEQDFGTDHPKSQSGTLDEEPQVTAKVPMSDFGGFDQSPKTGLSKSPKSRFGTPAYIELIELDVVEVPEPSNDKIKKNSASAAAANDSITEEDALPLINFNEVKIPAPKKPAARPRADRSTEDPDFDRAWALYDYKKSKADAQRAWKKAVAKVGAETLLAAIPPYVASTCKPGEPKRSSFRAYMATWLNGERWNDEIEPPTKGYQGRAGSDAKEGWEYEESAKKASVPKLIRGGVVPSEEMALVAYYHWHRAEQAEWPVEQIQEAGNTAEQAEWLHDAYTDGIDPDLYQRFFEYFSISPDSEDAR